MPGRKEKIRFLCRIPKDPSPAAPSGVTSCLSLIRPGSMDTLPFSSFWKLKVTSFDRMKKSVLDSG